MKIIRIFFLLLLALSLISCTCIFIFFQTFDTDQYLPQITEKATTAIGRPVSIRHVGLGISMLGIALDATAVSIADDPTFTKEPFITIDRVRIILDTRSLLLKRQIRIVKIIFQSPEIHFIRSEDGNFNASSIGHTAAPVSVTAGEAKQSFTSKKFTSPLPSVVRNDTVNNKNILFPVKSIKSIIIQNAAISFIDQDHVIPLDIWLTNINATLKDASFSNPMEFSLTAALYSNVPNVHVNTFMLLDPLKYSIQIDHLKFDMDLSKLDANQLKDISSETDNPVFKSTIGVMQLNVSHLDTAAAGGMLANGDISFTGGVINNFNIINVLMSRVMESFGGIVSIDSLFKGHLKDIIEARDTVIEKANADFSFHDKTFFVNDSLIQTDVFEFIAKGTIDKGLNTDMQTTLNLSGDVSAALGQELDMLKYLMDDRKRITIGATLQGVIPHLKYKTNKDFKKKTKKAFIAGGGSILGVLLGGGKI